MGKKRKVLHQHAPGKPGGRPKRPAQHNPGPQKSPNGAAKPKKKHQQQQTEKPTIPFERHDRILLVGEGDLSFAASLVEHHGCTNVTATVLEKDAAELLAKYPHVEDNAAVIRGERRNPKAEDEEGDKKEDNGEEEDEAAGESKRDDKKEDGAGNESEGGSGNEDADDFYNDDDEFDDEGNPVPKRNNKIVYNIDATKLPNSLTRTPFDRIFFNFPHVGGKSTDVNRQVRHNQSLLVAFFERALNALPPRGGAVIVTLFEGEPYTLWNVRDLARHAGLQVERSFRFQASVYPGYRHARTLGVVRNALGEATGGGWRGEDRAARSYVFKRKGDVAPEGKKRRRGDDSSDDDDDD